MNGSESAIAGTPIPHRPIAVRPLKVLRGMRSNWKEISDIGKPVLSLEPYLGRIGPHLLPSTSGTQMLPYQNRICYQIWSQFRHTLDEKHVFETDAPHCDIQHGTLMVPVGTNILPPNFFTGFYTQLSDQLRWSTLFSLGASSGALRA